MKTKVKQLDTNRVEIQVTIEEETISERIAQRYKEIARQYRFPGFRPGKAPRPVIDSQLGKDYVCAVVTDNIVNDTYPQAIDKTDIFPVGNPKFDDENINLVENGKEYSYSFEIDTKPVFELSDYSQIEIEMPSKKVSEEQIDKEVERLLEHYMEIIPAGASAKIKKDSYLEMKITAHDDAGEAIDALSNDSSRYGLGTGLYPPEFDKELIGLKKGDKKHFSIDTPKDSYAIMASLAGKTKKIVFDVEVLEVLKKQLPKLTDEWVQSKIGVDNVDEMRKELKDEIESANANMQPRLKESRSLEKLAERLKDEIPQNLIDETKAGLLQNFFGQLQSQGITFDAYLQQVGMNSDQFMKDLEEQAKDVTKQDLALDAYAVHEKIDASESDIVKEFEKEGAKNAAQLLEQWRDKGQLHLIKQGVIRQKAAAHLSDHVKVKEEKPKATSKAKPNEKSKK